jgi:hypothetical protein
MKIKIELIILLLLLSLIPVFASADKGMIVWPPEVHLDQSAQNAIVAWSGREEIIILSTSIKSESSATVLEILPLPANPTEIKEGNFEVFEKLVKVMNEKIKKIQEEWRTLEKGNLPSGGIEIVFHEKIGVHDITVVKVNNLNSFIDWIRNFAKEKNFGVKEISIEFENGLKNYLKRGINYFVFDVIDVKGEESIKPIIYKFSSDYFYYPMLISGISEISESKAEIKLFLITKEKFLKEIPEIEAPNFYWRGRFGYPVELTQTELAEISQDIKNLFDSSVYVRTFDYYGYLKEFKKDIIFYPKIWKRYLSIGSRGEDVKALQKILINEGYWDSDVEATGYFGPITKNALIKFQEYFKEDILKPWSLNFGTGYFGPTSKGFLEKGLSLSF